MNRDMNDNREIVIVHDLTADKLILLLVPMGETPRRTDERVRLAMLTEDDARTMAHIVSRASSRPVRLDVYRNHWPEQAEQPAAGQDIDGTHA